MGKNINIRLHAVTCCFPYNKRSKSTLKNGCGVRAAVLFLIFRAGLETGLQTWGNVVAVAVHVEDPSAVENPRRAGGAPWQMEKNPHSHYDIPYCAIVSKDVHPVNVDECENCSVFLQGTLFRPKVIIKPQKEDCYVHY